MALKRGITYPYSKKVSLKFSAFNGIDEITDRHMLNDNLACDFSNFCYKSGALTQSYGVNYLKLPLYNQEHILYTLPSFNGKTIQQLFHYKKFNNELERPDDELIILSNNTLYRIRLYDSLFQASVIYSGFYEKASACNYNYNGKDVLLISSIVNGLYIYDGTTFTKVNDTPHIKSLIVHNERVFALVSEHPYSVWFSDDFNPSNWKISLNEGGFINMSDELGEVKKIVALPDAIYIFRDYGIVRLYAKGDQRDFILSNFYNSNNIIYDRTIATDNNCIFFAQEKSITVTDGTIIKTICNNIGKTLGKLNYKYCEAVINSNRYILSARERAIDSTTMPNAENDYNDTVLIIDLNDYSIQKITSLDIKCLLSLNARHFNHVIMGLRGTLKGFLMNFDNSGKLLTIPFSKKWVSPTIDLNFKSKKKILERFTIYSKYDLKIKFNMDGYEVLYNISGGKRSIINVNKGFYELYYTIIADTGEASVLPPELVISVNGD